ncbi:hypothetical protein T265_16038, partial [Opisthorchis viverrini]
MRKFILKSPRLECVVFNLYPTRTQTFNQNLQKLTFSFRLHLIDNCIEPTRSLNTSVTALHIENHCLDPVAPCQIGPVHFG